VLSFILLYTVLEAVAGWSRVYTVTLTSAEIGRVTGLDQIQRRQALEQILDYALGRGDQLQFTLPPGSLRAGEPAFSPDELAHMADVRRLFVLGRGLRNAGLAGFFGLGFFGWEASRAGDRRQTAGRRRWRAACGLTLLWAGAWGAALLAAAGLGAVLNFRAAFDVFHMLLFENNLWLLPADALLIQLLPEEQFAMVAAAAGGAFALATLAALTAGLLPRRGGRRA
jgi:hypothetical protein